MGLRDWFARRPATAAKAQREYVVIQGTTPKAIHGRLRQIVQARRNSYRAANNPRSRNTSPNLVASGDLHADAYTRRLARELARDLDRNAGPCQTIHDKLDEFSVGGGVRTRFLTADPTWNQRAAELLHAEMARVRGGLDARQLRSGYALQSMWARQLCTDGDLAVLKLADGTCQTIESEQITGAPSGGFMTASLHEGLAFTPAGAIERLYVCPFDRDTGALRLQDAQDYGPSECLFTTNARRNSQTRGLPDLVAILDDFERADSYIESETIAAELSAQIWVTMNYRDGQFPTAPMIPGNSNQNEQAVRGGLNAGGTPDWQPTVAGSALIAPDGMKAEPWNPGRPNRDAEPFVIFLQRGYCAVVGLPYELVFCDLRNMSWSVANQLVGMANVAIARRQERHLAPLFSDIVRWRIRRFIAQGLLPDRPDWDAHEHEWPRIPPPNAADYFNANLVGLQSGQTSLQGLFGTQAWQILDERALEYRRASELARTLNADFPEFRATPDHFLGGLPSGSAPATIPPAEAPRSGTNAGSDKAQA
jgi:capsid protein